MGNPQRPPNPALPKRVDFELAEAGPALTHYLFRYPAKFHPPVVRALLDTYTAPGSRVLDPFCGSGTLLVEAVVSGRNAIGVDVDPVAVAVSNAKSRRYRADLLALSAQSLREALASLRRPAAEYENRKFNDLNDAQYEKELRQVAEWVPAVPNLLHWFRRYVVIDLARIRRAIHSVDVPEPHRRLLEVVFASIIRNASNADPVPVSGLEVTSHMKRRDAAGRVVDPFALFERALSKALKMTAEFAKHARDGVAAHAVLGDATDAVSVVDGPFDALITSPPYHGAVDYYRRHQLEMFWLGHVGDQKDRLDLLERYIGRPKVPQRHPFVSEASLSTALAKEWETKMRSTDAGRADAFRHYMVAMTRCFDELTTLLPPGAPALFIVGHSAWNGSEVPTTDLFAEIAGDAFDLQELLTYPVKNRYMSYARRNDAGISREYVLVFRRT
jgi:hypothetical protein